MTIKSTFRFKRINKVDRDFPHWKILSLTYPLKYHVTLLIMNYIRQRLLDIEQQTWISEIHNDERKDPHQKNKLRTFRKFKLAHDYSQMLETSIIE